MRRSMYLGGLRKEHIGQYMTVMGWVWTKRDMGGVLFVDLRDREGTLQVVFNQSNMSQEHFAAAEGLKNETVIAVSGYITQRDEETYNPKIATGEVELRADSIEVLSEAGPLPFKIEDNTDVREDVRLKYRFLDLRRPTMYKNLKFRQDILIAVRNFLVSEGFLEVETPVLTKSTPEGARDYLVPSRVHPGSFYALPQSPQVFKQLLMVGGIDKYYQVAKCFRDEDLRADRQPEFTQVDMEMSFMEQEEILCFLERLFKEIMLKTKNIDIKEPFTRLTWQEAMDKYGSDKPDLRFDLPIVDITDLAEKCSFSVFQNAVKSGGKVRLINAKGCADFSRSRINELTEKAVSYGAKGMAWIAVRGEKDYYSILTKYFTEEEFEEIIKRADAKPGDFILFCADKLDVVRKTLGNLRLDLADILELKDKKQYKFLIVTDFPQFEYSETEGRFMAMHHPFTMPYPEDIDYLISDPARVRAQAYDFVLNGIELGSGSIRIHRQDIQQKMFEALGFSDEDIEQRFGFFVNAFKYGTPPHGGFAFGLDRLVMLLIGAPSLRETIAFPKLKDASCILSNAPDRVDPAQLEILGIEIAGEKAEESAGVSKKKSSAEIDVDNVALLSRLKLSPEERNEMKKDLASIIDFADQLAEIDTSNVSATAHVLPVSNVFRNDIVNASESRDTLLSNAPEAENGYVSVPRVVE